jgi:hypothetical protein
MWHLGSTVRTTVATIRGRKVTPDAFHRIKSQVDSIRDKLTDTRHQLQYVEDLLNSTHQEITLLEPAWEERR